MAEPTPGSEQNSESARVYVRFKELFGGHKHYARTKRNRKTDAAESVPFGVGRDPKGVGDVLGALTSQLGWDSPLAQSELVSNWTELAGEETANHSSPVGIEDGVLTVQCESTAWATQLRLMRVDIMTHIAVRYPEAGIESIRFLGPNVPTFKRGPRSVQGRGVRDTYG